MLLLNRNKWNTLLRYSSSLRGCVHDRWWASSWCRLPESVLATKWICIQCTCCLLNMPTILIVKRGSSSYKYRRFLAELSHSNLVCAIIYFVRLGVLVYSIYTMMKLVSTLEWFKICFFVSLYIEEQVYIQY